MLLEIGTEKLSDADYNRLYQALPEGDLVNIQSASGNGIIAFFINGDIHLCPRTNGGPAHIFMAGRDECRELGEALIKWANRNQ